MPKSIVWPRLVALLGAGAALALGACTGSAAVKTPAAPGLPGPGAASSTITAAAGGTLKTSDGKVTLTFPPGAVTADIKVTATPLTGNDLPVEARAANALGVGYRLAPDGTKFAKPVAVSFVVTDVASDPSGRVRFPVLVSRSGTGPVAPLDHIAIEVTPAARSLTATAETSHFSDLYIYTYSLAFALRPEMVDAFVGDPPWTADVGFLALDARPVPITNIQYLSDNPPVARPGVISHPNMSATQVAKGLQDSPPSFDCVKAGRGIYAVQFTAHLPPGGYEESLRVRGEATCVEKPIMKASLEPPSTIFTIDPVAGFHNFDWDGTKIGCGTFTSLIDPSVVRQPRGAEARWTHPNAPTPDLAHSDADGDGIPDYCPHSDVPNFSHPGHVTVTMQDAGGHDVYCIREGSLTGDGECHPGKPPA